MPMLGKRMAAAHHKHQIFFVECLEHYTHHVPSDQAPNDQIKLTRAQLAHQVIVNTGSDLHLDMRVSLTHLLYDRCKHVTSSSR
ncbi:hypothetical protein D3C81_2032540 [compost metagenome]